MTKKSTARFPVVSFTCGILAAVAAGFLFNDQFQRMNPGTDGIIEGLVIAAAFLLTGLATGWK